MNLSGKGDEYIATPRKEDVAIIGMACVFPKAPDLKTYWQNILAKVDAISEPPEDRRMDEFFDPEPGVKYKTYCKRGGYLEKLPRFSPRDHGIMPVAIDGAEPEHFLALQVAHQALVDAGFPDKPFNRERTEVILGRGTYVSRGLVTVLHHGAAIHLALDLLKKLHPEYTEEQLEGIEKQLRASVPPFSSETAPGLVPSVMAGLVANRLDLRGANYVVDAACASALVAAQIGMQDLLSGKCDAVLTGAVQTSAPSFMNILFAQLGALTRHRELRPFSEDADGTMIGEGIGMMVLKRRTDAERDGHRIYALIKGVGSSSDGRARGILAPRAEGEELALRRAYEAAGLSHDTIELLEAHGTGLPLGDLTEIEALRKVFGPREGGAARCAMGSVKSMIGHLLPAAGIAGIMKAALALHHKILPPTLHAGHPNPKLEIDKTPFYLNTETRPWIHGAADVPRRAGVNAFGFGGINAHAVLEEYRGVDESAMERFLGRWDTELIVIEAESREGLIRQCRHLVDDLKAAPGKNLLDLACTLNSTALKELCRLSIVASSVEEFVEKVAHAVERLEDPKRCQIKDKSGIYFFEDPLARGGRLAFLFPGEGSQYPNMLADLCLHFPQVRSCFDTLDRAYARLPREFVPSQRIFPLPNDDGGEPSGEEDLWQMDYAVDAVLTADRAIYELLRSLGICPHVILGHSSGEIMALEAAGAIEVSGEEERMEHILAGNAMIQSFFAEVAIPAAHLVAVGGTSREVVTEVVRESGGRIFVAMENCPHQVVLCCDREVLDGITERFRKAGGICQVLPFARPYHTPLFEPGRRSLEAFFGRVEIRVPKVEMYSCVTAKPMPVQPAEVRKLAVGQWAKPVRFQETVESMYGAGVRLFMEVGPKANLSSFVSDTLKGKRHLAVASNVHYRSGTTQLNHALGLLAAHGVPMRLDSLYRGRSVRSSESDKAAGAQGSQGSDKTAVKISLGLPMPRLQDIQSFRKLAAPPPVDVDLFKSEALIGGPGPETPRSPNPEQARRAKGMAEQAHFAALTETGPRQQPVGRRSQVMEEYFQTMEQFLAVQEEIMSGYLGDGRPSVVPKEGVVSTYGTASSAASSSHLPGIDEGFGLIGRQASIAKTGAPVAVSEGPSAASDSPHLSNENIGTLLITLVSERTGYPMDMLKPDLDLEAELGIDSIKRVEILGALSKQLGSFSEEQIERLRHLKTLGEIIRFLESSQERSGQTCDTTSPPFPEEEATMPPEESLDSPFAGRVLRIIPDREVVVRRVLDLKEDLFLRDHTLGGRVSKHDPELLALPVVPLFISLEIMAEAAARLFRNRVLAGVKEVKAHDWVMVQGGRLEVEIQAKMIVDASEAGVQLRIVDPEERQSKLVMEAVMVFQDSYEAPPEVKAFMLKQEGPCRIRPEQFYPYALFHGLSFQSVGEVNRCGTNGLEAYLKVPFQEGLFRGMAHPRFLSSPMLLDGAGQAIGLWAAHTLETDFVVFPMSVSDIRFFSPITIPLERVVCYAHTTLEGESLIVSDVDLTDENGKLAVRLRGLQHRRIKMPEILHLFRGSRDIMLSTPWQVPLERFDNADNMVCCRFDPKGMDFTSADGRVMREVIAHIILSRRERETWAQLKGPEKRRTEWLLARVAGKEAVRLVLKKLTGIDIWPADIDLQKDFYGQPLVGGEGVHQLDRRPIVSLSHAGGASLAIAGAGTNGLRVGIDMEPLGSKERDFLQLAFSAHERELLTKVDPSRVEEWILRLWCAKEAVAKSLGRGLPGGPRDLSVCEVDSQSGIVILEASETLSRELPRVGGKSLRAVTLKEEGLVAAIAIFDGGNELGQ
jgi:acyl transferase domain-containing protein/phosphopantetheinyl transferase/acyl carrier protein